METSTSTTHAKAITVRQPYAELLVTGVKTLETRTLNIKHRGRLYIHAGKSIDEQLLKEQFEIPRFASAFLGYKSDGIPISSLIGKVFQMQKAAIIGHVEVIDCIEAWRWIKENHAQKRELVEHEKAIGDLSGNRFVWVCKNPVKYEKPILCNGAQGFWNCTEQMKNWGK